MIETRAAKPADAEAAVDLLRRSITELCIADHHDDAATLEAWLANKTVERFARWLASPETYLVVAEEAGALAGVGSLHQRGELLLCYVRPGSQRRGVGRALLTALEARARAWQLTRLYLLSSSGARAFYERAGYTADGAPKQGFGLSVGYPYARRL
jgi:N-acetylglutamate synthase-like GNAT family acetyltransferase